MVAIVRKYRIQLVKSNVDVLKFYEKAVFVGRLDKPNKYLLKTYGNSLKKYKNTIQILLSSFLTHDFRFHVPHQTECLNPPLW